jgi:predicted Zn-dependent protease
MAYFIKKDGNVYSFLGYATSADFPTYENLFSATMTGMKTLTDRNKLNRKPDRIRIKTVAKSSSLRDALKNLKVTDDALEDHALLNGDIDLNKNVKRGLKLKIIEKG